MTKRQKKRAAILYAAVILIADDGGMSGSADDLSDDCLPQVNELGWSLLKRINWPAGQSVPSDTTTIIEWAKTTPL